MIGTFQKGDETLNAKNHSATSMGEMGNGILPTGTKILFGSTPKGQQGPLSISFTAGFFSVTPVVVTTPYWPGGGNPLPTETVINISTEAFEVISTNASDLVGGAPYFVNWIAVGT
jgi:hypothetical protein